MTQEGEQDSLFVFVEAVVPTFSAGAIGPLAVDENNRAYGAEEKNAPMLLSGCTSNLRLEDMVELRRQVIAIDSDNDPEPANVPRQGINTTGTGNWRREGIICPRKAGKLQNFHFFQTLFT